MNKAIQILLLALCAIGIKSEYPECGKIDFPPDVTKTKDMANYCRILTTGMNRTHCCLFKKDDEAYCSEISDDAYENIKRYKKYLRNYDTYSGIEIKCSSDYFAYSLFILFALLALLI